MATTTNKRTESNRSIVETVRRAGTEAIETYERQAKDAITQSEELVTRLPAVGPFAEAQASLARAVVDVQGSTARWLIGA
jgi:hypothetical protein